MTTQLQGYTGPVGVQTTQISCGPARQFVRVRTGPHDFGPYGTGKLHVTESLIRVSQLSPIMITGVVGNRGFWLNHQSHRILT